MSTITAIVAIGLGIAVLYSPLYMVYFIVCKKPKVPDPPKVTTPKSSCISIPSAGGFGRLCHTDAPHGTIGANIPGINLRKSNVFQILPQHPSEYGIKNLVQVEVHAFGLNYADCCIRWGLYSSAKECVGWPITPGFEFSGKVKWIGDDANNRFKIGDEVFGVSQFGAYTTAITVPQHQLWHKPKTLSMSEAAGFLCTGMTACYALFYLAAPTKMPYVDKAVIRHTNAFYADGDSKQNDDTLHGVKVPPQCVLIHSASGGVGSMLAQMCKRVAGFTCVIGVVGGQHKVEMAEQMGCDVVIDRKSKHLKDGNIWDEMKRRIPDLNGLDVVFDANGVTTLKQSYENLKATGRVIVYGFHTMLPHSGWINPFQWIQMGYNLFKTPKFNPMELVNENKAVLGFNLSFLFSRTDILKIAMASLLEWIESGQVKVSKVTEYKMKDVGKAHKDIQSGNTIGKLVMITPHHVDYDKR